MSFSNRTRKTKPFPFGEKRAQRASRNRRFVTERHRKDLHPNTSLRYGSQPRPNRKACIVKPPAQQWTAAPTSLCGYAVVVREADQTLMDKGLGRASASKSMRPLLPSISPVRKNWGWIGTKSISMETALLLGTLLERQAPGWSSPSSTA
jgi:hypothetical protein